MTKKIFLFWVILLCIVVICPISIRAKEVSLGKWTKAKGANDFLFTTKKDSVIRIDARNGRRSSDYSTYFSMFLRDITNGSDNYYGSYYSYDNKNSTKFLFLEKGNYKISTSDDANFEFRVAYYKVKRTNNTTKNKAISLKRKKVVMIYQDENGNKNYWYKIKISKPESLYFYGKNLTSIDIYDSSFKPVRQALICEDEIDTRKIAAGTYYLKVNPLSDSYCPGLIKFCYDTKYHIEPFEDIH